MTDTTAIAPHLTLGNRLAVARHRTGLSLRQVADRVPTISMSALAKWEADDREPGLFRIARLARFYDVDLRWLVEGIDIDDVEAFSTTQSGGPTSRYIGSAAMPGQQRFTLHAGRSPHHGEPLAA